MRFEILKFLIKQIIIPTPYCGMPIPSSYIAKRFNISQYKCKKHLHELKDKGLVEVVRGGYYDDYYGKNFLYCGWSITKKAQETKIYKTMETKILKENAIKRSILNDN